MMISQPLLVVDGDSFAHRAYHALPKTIRRDNNRPAGAILGFANMLLRLYLAEQPRAVLVAWDTLDAPTYRHTVFEDYQGGRKFDDELIEQLELIPDFVTACGFANTKAAGYEADDFLAAAAAREEKRGGTVLVASGANPRAVPALRAHPAVVAMLEADPVALPDMVRRTGRAVTLRSDPSLGDRSWSLESDG